MKVPNRPLERTPFRLQYSNTFLKFHVTGINDTFICASPNTRKGTVNVLLHGSIVWGHSLCRLAFSKDFASMALGPSSCPWSVCWGLQGDQIVKRCIYGNASEDLAVTDGSDWCHEGIKKTTLCLLHNKGGHRQLQALSGSRSEGSSCQGQDWGRNRRAILVRDSPGILVKNCKGLFLLHFTTEIRPQSNHTHKVSHASWTAAFALIVHWLINHAHIHTHTHTQLL